MTACEVPRVQHALSFILDMPLSWRCLEDASEPPTAAADYIRALHGEDCESLATYSSGHIAETQGDDNNVECLQQVKMLLQIYAYGALVGRPIVPKYPRTHREEAKEAVFELASASSTSSETEDSETSDPEQNLQQRQLNSLKENQMRNIHEPRMSLQSVPVVSLNPHAAEWFPANVQKERNADAAERIRQFNLKAQEILLASSVCEGFKFSSKELLGTWFRANQGSNPDVMPASDVGKGENIFDLFYLADKGCFQVKKLHIVYEEV